MHPSPRPWLVSAVVVLAAASVGVALPSWPDLARRGEPAQSIELCPCDPVWEVRLAAVKKRIAAKAGLVKELVAGRLALADVAARFRAMDAGEPVIGGW